VVRAAKGQQLALTASAPFRMILSPTALKLKSEALKIVKEATTQQVLEYSSSLLPLSSSPAADAKGESTTGTAAASVASIEIVFQKEEFLPDVLATHISFFALATYRALEPDETISKVERQKNLNALLEQAFSTTDRRGRFLQRIRGRIANSSNSNDTNQAVTTEQLQILESLVVVSVLPFTAAPAPVEIDDRDRLLSTLDIILITISATILVGILWMLWEHYKDRGYIENQRQQVLNSPGPSLFSIPRAYFEEGFNVDDEESAIANESLSASAATSRFSTYDERPILDMKDVVIEPSPSTPSTIADSMITYSEESSPPFSVSDSTSAIFGSGMRSHFPLPEPRNLLPPRQSDEDEDDMMSGVTDFENNWFRKESSSVSRRPTRKGIYRSKDDEDELSVPGDDDDNNSSDDDVFFVAKDSSTQSPSRRSLEYSISEWMSSIQVTPSDRSAAASVFTEGSHSFSLENRRGDDSARSHTIASLLEISTTLEQRSLEHSMASSSSDADDSVSTVFDEFENDEKKSNHR